MATAEDACPDHFFLSEVERLINLPRTISRFLPQLHRKIEVNKIHEEKQEERTRPSQPKQGVTEKSRGKRETCKSQIAFFFFFLDKERQQTLSGEMYLKIYKRIKHTLMITVLFPHRMLLGRCYQSDSSAV